MKKRKRWAGIILPILIQFLVSSYPTSWMSHFKWPSLPSWYSTREACDDNGGMMGRLPCFLGSKIGCHCRPRRHHCRRQHLPRLRQSLRRGRYMYFSWILLNASRMVSSKKAASSWVRNEFVMRGLKMRAIRKWAFHFAERWENQLKDGTIGCVDHFVEQLLPWDSWMSDTLSTWEEYDIVHASREWRNAEAEA